ncbi:MAG: DsrE family protein [Candidatus Desulfovibrio faecigallinarum]|uniref:DsrE family protein n=1 Tax=Desulfovibrio sp. An276 TaxID=1965618 RepID=UPI000B3ADCA7|nr:DsrE family protein [Desulfovibrio sp. An276]MBU3832703.1 DsrE family protein [Candidatus Desulfovibrio faecigallinarum]OUO51020.1 hypothetical protein B5F76_10460 [Desulfovibrio sp. An276]
MNYNLLLHVDLNEPQRLNLAFDNIANYMKYLAEHPEASEARIVLVANGPAVNLFIKNWDRAELQERGRKFMEQGVSIRLCQNALNKFEIASDQLWEGCVAIPGAIPEIIRLQNEGYSYIKP